MSFTYINFIIVLLIFLVTFSDLVASWTDPTPSFGDIYSILQLAENNKLFYFGNELPCDQRVFFNENQYDNTMYGCSTESKLQAVLLNLNEKNIKASLVYLNNIASSIYEMYFTVPFRSNTGNFELLDKQIDLMHQLLDNVDNIFFAYIKSRMNIHDYCIKQIDKYKTEFEYYPYWGFGEYFGSSKIMPTQEQIKYTKNLKSLCERAKLRFR